MDSVRMWIGHAKLLVALMFSSGMEPMINQVEVLEKQIRGPYKVKKAPIHYITYVHNAIRLLSSRFEDGENPNRIAESFSEQQAYEDVMRDLAGDESYTLYDEPDEQVRNYVLRAIESVAY